MNRLSFKKTVKGFTLLELLVVMVIISILVSVAGLSVRAISKADDMTAWISSFRQNFEYAIDLSALKRKSHGIQFGSKDLSFLQYENSEWVASKDTALSLMKYPKDSFIDLYVNGDKQLIDDKKKPKIIINISTLVTPFEIHLNRSKTTHILKIESSGEIFATQRK